MTHLTLKDVLRVTSSVFTIKNLLRTASAIFLFGLFSFVILLQYYSTKTAHQKQTSSVLPSLQDMESQTISYIKGDEVDEKVLTVGESNDPLDQNGNVLSFIDPKKETAILKKDKVFMNMDPKTYLKGEKMSMNSVSFYAGSTVLLKKSEAELQKLLTMLNENPKLKVKILGHTEKNYWGKIKKAREESIQTLFSTENCRTVSGNSKKLSVLRVRILETYLVKSGISRKRIMTKGWGGKNKVQKNMDLKLDDSFLVEVEMLN